MTLLNAYLISGIIPYNEIASPASIISLSGNRPYIISPTTPSGYQDITSIKNWDFVWFMGGLRRDYLFVQNEIAELVAALGWNTLLSKEKRIASQWITVDAEKRGQILNFNQQTRAYVDFLVAARNARFIRCQFAFSEIFLRLQPIDSQEIMNDFGSGMIINTSTPGSYANYFQEQTIGLASRFIEYGIKGTLEGDKEGLFDYVEARTGTSFENTGLRAKNITPSGITINQLHNRTMRVLASGFYNTRNQS